MENIFEGDEHSKKLRLQSWICAFQDAKVMEDESIRTYIGSIIEIIAGIRSQGWTKEDDEVISKILKTLTPQFKSVVQMIQLLISCTKYFTKETFLGRIEAIENKLRQSRELTRIETTFNALNIWPSLSRSTSARGDFASSNIFEEDRKIEGVALLVRRQKGGKKIFKCWTCDEYGHYASKCPKREKKYKGNIKPRKDRECFYEKEENDSDEQALRASDDEIGFVAIKEESLEKVALIS